MSKSVAVTLIVIAVAIVIFGVAEHLFFRITIIPHLAIILGVVALILAAAGIYGMMNSARTQKS